jgi:Protein of unknown function (DUF2946)
MRRHLQKFLPVVLIALMVQVLAPIGACWAAAIAASDPLGLAAICHDGAAASGQQGDQGGGHRTHDGACAICCVLHAGAPAADTPRVPTLATPYRQAERVVWRDEALNLSAFRTGSNSQARAPPLSM